MVGLLITVAATRPTPKYCRRQWRLRSSGGEQSYTTHLPSTAACRPARPGLTAASLLLARPLPAWLIEHDLGPRLGPGAVAAGLERLTRHDAVDLDQDGLEREVDVGGVERRRLDESQVVLLCE